MAFWQTDEMLITGKSGKGYISCPTWQLYLHLSMCLYLCICNSVFVYFFANRGNVDCMQVWEKLDLLPPLATVISFVFMYFLFVLFCIFGKQRKCWLQASLENIRSPVFHCNCICITVFVFLEKKEMLIACKSRKS